MYTRIGQTETSKSVVSIYPKVKSGKLDGVTIGKVKVMTAAEKTRYCK